MCNKRVQRQFGKEYIVNFSRQGKDAFAPTNSIKLKKTWSWPFSECMYSNLPIKKSFV